jgi:hypothetical protein
MLLANLRHTEFWPMEPAAVGTVLERMKLERANLLRWQESGHGRRWVDAHQGQWLDDEWFRLLQGLQGSVFWPLEADAVSRALQGYRIEWHNLRLWEQSGEPRRWVESHQGTWEHGDWLALVKALRRSAYWPLDLDAAGGLLGGLKGRFRSLQRWPSLLSDPEREQAGEDRVALLPWPRSRTAIRGAA